LSRGRDRDVKRFVMELIEGWKVAEIVWLREQPDGRTTCSP
jgi:hypothetical protein